MDGQDSFNTSKSEKKRNKKSKHNMFLKYHTYDKKGQNGTVLIIGGSKRYTGAPIFTALGAFISGAELVYIFTDEPGAATIKMLYEAIVMPMENDKFILDKITSCVVGPGLGIIQTETVELINLIVEYLNSRDVPFIIDADALHLYKHGQFQNIKNCILTPNIKEAVGLTIQNNHLCLYKGYEDRIIYGDKSHLIKQQGSSKRIGGQGDVLSGILATFVGINKNNIFEACIMSCMIMRKSSLHAFKRKGYSLMISDVLKSLGKHIKKLTFK